MLAFSKHIKLHLFATTVLVVMINLPGFSQITNPQNNQEGAKAGATDGVEFMSFVFDETITKIGADFFRMFNTDWENPTDIQGVSLYIGEQPMPGMGTQIWVKADERYVFRSFVRPSQTQLQEAVKTALKNTRNYFINYEVIQQQLNSDDFKGSGLF